MSYSYLLIYWCVLMIIQCSSAATFQNDLSKPTQEQELTKRMFNGTTFSMFGNEIGGLPKNRQKRAAQITLVRIVVKNLAENISSVSISCHDQWSQVCRADDILKYGEQMGFTIFDIFTIKYTCYMQFENGKNYSFECYDGKRGFRGGTFEIRNYGVWQLKVRKPAQQILSFVS